MWQSIKSYYVWWKTSDCFSDSLKKRKQKQTNRQKRPREKNKQNSKKLFWLSPKLMRWKYVNCFKESKTCMKKMPVFWHKKQCLGTKSRNTNFLFDLVTKLTKIVKYLQKEVSNLHFSLFSSSVFLLFKLSFYLK